MNINPYIKSINQRFMLGNATEHTFRGDLQNLIEELQPKIRATNEPKRQKCGAPDYILTHKDVPIGFIEAKDVGDADLDGLKKSGNKEQFDRYKASLENLIFTDYINFHWYKDGELVMQVSIAKIFGNKIVPLEENYTEFEQLITQFCSYSGQTIKSAKKLAKMMAGKARLLADVIEKSLDSDEQNAENSSLKAQFAGFEQVLIKGIKNREFAEVYAQTIAYGMFAARLYDDTLDTFSRQEAAELIPKSNPFLRKLFSYISGIDIDERIKWIVDSLADVFRSADVRKILDGYGKSTQMEDPIIHFYETFLAEYDPKLRKARGVWYTPHPVVNFIIRAIDEILKTEFGLSMGLADSSKVKIKTKVATNDKRSKTGYTDYEKEVHRVQLLDPATGTGTFLVEFIKEIFKKFKGQEGLWNEYVEKHLIPRLNGFELLMASYAMAHLKLDLVLKETGYKSTNNQRIKVFLTNSLEAPKTEDINLFMAQWLSQEAVEADIVKRETPVMVVAGNPPYSGISSNNGKWISDLIEDYKYVDGEHFKERKHWLNDDYVKFIRYGQHYIEKNGSGILAYINPHGFLDNPTFRGMRWHLLKTFDKIYTIDLHGNAKKKETTPDGGIDENVFDIMQGVSINFFIKTGKKKKKELGKVYHYDLFGKREFKYNFLTKNNLSNVKFQELDYNEPNFYFLPKDETGRKEYQEGFKVDDLFTNNTSGIVSMGDAFIFDKDSDQLLQRIRFFLQNDLTEEEIKNKYKLGKNYSKWIIKNKSEIKKITLKPVKVSYRPFDDYYTIFDNKLLWRWRYDTMKHIFNHENYNLIVPKAHKDESFNHCFLSKELTEAIFLSSKTASNAMILPLYIYPETNAQQTLNHETEETTYAPQGRTPNLNKEIIEKIAEYLGLEFVPDHELLKEPQRDKYFTPLDLLDYIYAVLHSPIYRDTYKEFLKIDFPRVPYPGPLTPKVGIKETQEKFWQLVKLGGEIRQLHLLESPILDNYITSYPISGNNEVTRKMTNKNIGFELTNKEAETGKVWINDEQYFDNVPLVAWEFYIGGYQPAQKWLKDRKMRVLGFEDIIHYQKMIVALTETDRLMKEIDEVGFMEE